MGRLRLEPMSAEDVSAFVVGQLGEYTDQIERYAGWTREEAVGKATRDMAQTFPDGKPLPGHHFFHLVGEAGRVGVLWYRQDDRGLWLFQVTIDPEHRRQGFGREAMALLEAEATRLGAPRIELNVFGGNEAARELYRSLGYREEAVVMSKRAPYAPGD